MSKTSSVSGPAILILDQEGIGPRIAEARKLRNLTQAGLAVAAHCSKSLIFQVEQGTKPATPWLVAAVARALNTDVPSLLGQPYRGTTENSDRIHAAIPQIRIAMNYWDVPPDLEVAARPLTALRSDIASIGVLLDAVDYIKLGQRLPGLIEELSAVLHASTGSARRDAAELLMHAYIAAKSMAYRLGYVDLVSVAVDRASWAARETSSAELAAYLAEERCQIFFATGAYKVGLKFIDHVYQEYEPLLSGGESGLAIAGSMHLRAAIMAARDNERRGDAWDYLAQAREIGQRIGRDTNHYGLIFGPTNVKIHEVATAIELDDADEAIRRAEGFQPPVTLPVERSSHHYIDVARAELMGGRRKQSLDALMHADRLAPQHTRNHPMARETITGLIRLHRQVPESLRSMARRMRVEPSAF
jgi:transcriptional regulator with XRE-family HTH domain